MPARSWRSMQRPVSWPGAIRTVHHDLWDMDMPSQPTLADITVKGQTVPVIYAPAKTGNIFVLDRRNGQLVVPAPEKPVPQGAAKGDYVTKTQPFSDLSFRPTKDLTGADMWGRHHVRSAGVPRDVPSDAL
ncbi:quinoprotein glucose dehydrogenase [Citrobacter koseri]|uniref:Quinoprotein glucose dehydrogenase n=1 Tax=Citrobacter koseri TaxID=545 RepID=A0A2X2VHK0_CITKO|nr:quinoprotein glucose dehydrogenase [Citrobacter koseri]